MLDFPFQNGEDREQAESSEEESIFDQITKLLDSEEAVEKRCSSVASIAVESHDAQQGSGN